MDVKQGEIEIWSTYPPPYGGVSVHSMRLFELLKYKFDLKFKNFNGTINNPSERIFKINNQLFEIIKYLFKRNRIIHLHSNRTIVWFLMIFYPKSSRILLTIHNQSLKGNSSFVRNFIVKKFLNRVYCLFLNNNEFAEFLISKYRLNRNGVKVIPAFIAPLPRESEPIPKIIDEFINKHENILSSFAWKLYKVNDKDVYGIDQIIDAFAQLPKEHKSIGLILIIPIIEDKMYYKFILKKIESYNLASNVLIYSKAVKNGFDIWKRSDLFIRATTTDIEGISIKEALFFNTPVIATDVVERPTNVLTYKYGDINRLSLLMNEILNSKERSDFKINIPSGVSEIEKVYNSIINK